MQGEKSLSWGEKSTREKVVQAQGRHFHCSDGAKCSGTPSGGCVVGRCWEACSSWVPVSLLVSHGKLDSLKSLQMILKDRHNRARHGGAG